MTLQWTLIASILYAEILIVTMLLIPAIKSTWWNRLFRSRLASGLKGYLYFAHISVIGFAFLFLDAFRDVHRYSKQFQDFEVHPGTPLADVQIHMKLFRAQRNLHIAGLAIVLWFVIHRLVQKIANEARLQADVTCLTKQCEGMSKIAKERLVDQAEKLASGDGEMSELADAERKIACLKKELQVKDAELQAMKKQSEGLTTEYDKLSAEYQQFQEQVESKKDDKKSK